MNPRMLPTFLATLVATSVLVAPAAALADSRGHRGYGPPPGRVVVTNQSGGDVTLVLGGEVRELPAWRTTELLPPKCVQVLPNECPGRWIDRAGRDEPLRDRRTLRPAACPPVDCGA